MSRPTPWTCPRRRRNGRLKDAGGKPGVVIFTDSTYTIAILKAAKLKEIIEAGGGTVLQWVDTPIAETSSRMGPLTTTLLQTHGAKWTHSLAINDLYFDFMGPALAAAGIDGKANPKAGSAGDGSEAAFQRIRTGQFQTVTVAEPLNLQGWQLVDELNRAVQGAAVLGLHHLAGAGDRGGPQGLRRQQPVRPAEWLPRSLRQDVGQVIAVISTAKGAASAAPPTHGQCHVHSLRLLRRQGAAGLRRRLRGLREGPSAAAVDPVSRRRGSARAAPAGIGYRPSRTMPWCWQSAIPTVRPSTKP